MPSRAKKRRVRVPRATLPIVGVLGMVASGAYGQANETGGAGRRALTVQSSLAISETVTDNVNLSSTDKRSEAITVVSPSISLQSSAGRLQGSLNYGLSGIFYASGTQSNTVQQILNSSLRAEAVENFAYVDAAASISRQNVSAFGTQSTDSTLRTDNQAQVATYSLSPSIRGRLASLASYEVRLNYAGQHSGGGDGVGNSTSTGGNLHLGSDGGSSFVNWALDGSRQRLSYDQGRVNDSDAATASLIFGMAPDLHLSLRGGWESNNYNSLDKEGSKTYGATLDWKPSERTSLSAAEDQRFFGRSHRVDFAYRTPRTAWSYVDSRDVDSGQSNSGAPLTEYDLLYAQLASQYPDPALRAQQTTLLLQLLGRNPSTIGPGGFLTSAASLQRMQEVSAAYLGLRTTVTVIAYQSKTSRLDRLSAAVDSLSNGATIRQRGVSLSVGYRLTPGSSVSLLGSRSRSSDADGGLAGNQVTTFTAAWTGSLARGTSASFGARRTMAAGAAPYNESALFATITLQF